MSVIPESPACSALPYAARGRYQGRALRASTLWLTRNKTDWQAVTQF
jgi:hypothetical protein